VKERSYGVNIIIAIAFGIGVSTLLVLKSNVKEVLRNFKYFSSISVLVFLGVFILGTILDSTRMLIVVRKSLNRMMNFLDSFYNNLMGYFFTMITPFALGGQVYQVFHMTRLGIKTEQATNIMMTRFVEYMMISTVFSLYGFFRYKEVLLAGTLVAPKLIVAGYMVSLSSMGFVFISMFYPTWMSKSLSKLKRVKPFHAMMRKITKKEDWDESFTKWTLNLKRSVENLWLKDFHILMVDLTLNLVALLCQVLTFFLILKSIFHDLPLNFLDVAGIFFFLTLVIYYVPTPGASGGVEAIYQLTLSSLLKNPSKTMTVVLMWRTITYYIPILMGLIALGIYKMPSPGED